MKGLNPAFSPHSYLSQRLGQTQKADYINVSIHMINLSISQTVAVNLMDFNVTVKPMFLVSACQKEEVHQRKRTIMALLLAAEYAI